jgi:transposase
VQALDRRVLDALRIAFEARLSPPPPDHHPLHCHRPRIPGRDCFDAIVFRLVTGCSWSTAGRLGKGGATTLRSRRDQWLQAGAFDAVSDEALCGYGEIIGRDCSETAIDGSQQKAPCGGDGTGPNPTDRASPAGSGQSPPNVTGYPSAGSLPPPIATTASCSRPPSTPSPSGVSYSRSRPSTSTGAMTTRSYARSAPSAASLI